MNFTDTGFEGLVLVTRQPNEDFRGSFSRLWCEEEFRQQGLNHKLVQVSHCRNHLAGTLRGMHFQWAPSEEAKLVRCERGRVFDVVIDLRPHSNTFLQHFTVELDSDLGNAIFIPPGFAHGYQTLVDNSDLFYMMTDTYQPELADGFRYNDPAFGIDWPVAISNVLERDGTYPTFDKNDYIERFKQASMRKEHNP